MKDKVIIPAQCNLPQWHLSMYEISSWYLKYFLSYAADKNSDEHMVKTNHHIPPPLRSGGWGNKLKLDNDLKLFLHTSISLSTITWVKHSCLRLLLDILRLSSAPPTTSRLFSARIFSLKSSTSSTVLVLAYCPMTNNVGVRLSNNGSSASCQNQHRGHKTNIEVTNPTKRSQT